MQTALHVAQKVLIMEFINELPHARLARPQRALESKNQTDCNAGTVTVIFQASLILMLLWPTQPGTPLSWPIS